MKNRIIILLTFALILNVVQAFSFTAYHDEMDKDRKAKAKGTGESYLAKYFKSLKRLNKQNSPIDYLPLSGGTLTDALFGTSATFSSVVNGNNFFTGSGSYRWGNNQYNWSSAPHLTPSNSITLFDQYTNYGGSGYPTSFGTLFDLHGRNGHLNSQLYFGGSGELLYRHAFYGDNTWSSWQTILTSTSIQNHTLPLSGSSASFTGNVSITTGSYRWGNNQYHWSSAPRITPSNSITLFDQYANDGGGGSPTGYGTLLDLYGRSGHLNSQLYFGESGQLLYRHAFYGQNSWPSWQTLLSSTNVQEYALPITGGTLTGNLNGTSCSFSGNIRTKKLIVSQTGWPDYVFSPDYQLKPLSEVEKFIQKNKHLPDVPSASDIEENGISVGDNQALLLKKIEELTLYLIEMKKEIAELKSTTKSKQKK